MGVLHCPSLYWRLSSDISGMSWRLICLEAPVLESLTLGFDLDLNIEWLYDVEQITSPNLRTSSREMELDNLESHL